MCGNSVYYKVSYRFALGRRHSCNFLLNNVTLSSMLRFWESGDCDVVQKQYYFLSLYKSYRINLNILLRGRTSWTNILILLICHWNYYQQVDGADARLLVRVWLQTYKTMIIALRTFSEKENSTIRCVANYLKMLEYWDKHYWPSEYGCILQLFGKTLRKL